MAIKSFKVCDWCKKESIPDKSLWNDESVRKWESVELKFGQYNMKQFDLCPECLKKLGIIEENNKEISVSEPSNYEKLFEIISDIVNDAIDNR